MRNNKANYFLPVFIILFISFFGSTWVHADDGSLGRTPDGVFPIQENDVIMESEEITIDLEKNTVDCTFVFHNTGKNKDVFMGFPGKLDESRGSAFSDEVSLELRNFKTFVKGKQLPVTREKGIESHQNETLEALKYSEWFTFTIPFEANEKITVRNTYDFSPSYDSMGYIYTGYVLQTGALWKESIGSARVTFKLGKIQPYEIEWLGSGGFKFEGNNLVWEREGSEPWYDLNLRYNTSRYSEEFIKDIVPGSGSPLEEIKSKMDTYKKVEEFADKDDTIQLLEMYDRAVKEADQVLAIYINSFLPEDKISEERSKLGDISVEKRQDEYLLSCDIQGFDNSSIEISVSHNDNGTEIIDAQFPSSSCFVNFTPGIEYNITYTLRDWMDRTERKTLKYKVPEEVQVSAPEQAQITVFGQSPKPSVLPMDEEQAAETEKNAKNNSQNFFVFGILWVIVGGLSVVLVIMLYKRQHR